MGGEKTPMAADTAAFGPEALKDEILALGANAAAVISVDSISFDTAFRGMCASNACGNYGKSYMCPPDIGEIDDLIQEAKTYSHALVYQTIGLLEDSYDFEGMMEAGDFHNTLARNIRELFEKTTAKRRSIWAPAAAACARYAEKKQANSAASLTGPCRPWRLTASMYQNWRSSAACAISDDPFHCLHRRRCLPFRKCGRYGGNAAENARGQTGDG